MSRVLLVAVLVLALAGSASSAAPRHGSHVSASVPYVAPWQANFDRYSTQIYTFETTAFSQLNLTVPEGQWWRIVYVNGQWVTGATAATRTVFFKTTDANLNILFQELAPISQAANTVGTYVFGPGLTAFANTTDPANLAATATIPDVLWPPNTHVNLWVIAAKGGDQWGTLTRAAIEVYTESERPGVLKPVATPLVP